MVEPSFKAAALGPYQLMEQLAQGAYGEVYRARHIGPAGFQRILAIKRLKRHVMEDPDAVRAFENEARIGGLLLHHNIAQTLEFGAHDGEYYLAMEFVDGLSFADIITTHNRTRKPVPAPVALELIAQSCDGLHYAHEARAPDGAPLKLVHRDIKPSNLMLTRSGVVKVMDFGIARVDNQNLTDAGFIKGTPRYLSPEVISRHHPVDRRSDLFSLGAVFYELLIGKPLFDAPNLLNLMALIREAEVSAQLKELGRRYAGVARLLKKVLAPNPADRFQTGRELARELRHQRRELGVDEVDLEQFAQEELAQVVGSAPPQPVRPPAPAAQQRVAPPPGPAMPQRVPPAPGPAMPQRAAPPPAPAAPQRVAPPPPEPQRAAAAWQPSRAEALRPEPSFGLPPRGEPPRAGRGPVDPVPGAPLPEPSQGEQSSSGVPSSRRRGARSAADRPLILPEVHLRTASIPIEALAADLDQRAPSQEPDGPSAAARHTPNPLESTDFPTGASIANLSAFEVPVVPGTLQDLLAEPPSPPSPDYSAGSSPGEARAHQSSQLDLDRPATSPRSSGELAPPPARDLVGTEGGPPAGPVQHGSGGYATPSRPSLERPAPASPTVRAGLETGTSSGGIMRPVSASVSGSHPAPRTPAPPSQPVPHPVPPSQPAPHPAPPSQPAPHPVPPSQPAPHPAPPSQPAPRPTPEAAATSVDADVDDNFDASSATLVAPAQPPPRGPAAASASGAGGHSAEEAPAVRSSRPVTPPPIPANQATSLFESGRDPRLEPPAPPTTMARTPAPARALPGIVPIDPESNEDQVSTRMIDVRTVARPPHPLATPGLPQARFVDAAADDADADDADADETIRADQATLTDSRPPSRAQLQEVEPASSAPLRRDQAPSRPQFPPARPEAGTVARPEAAPVAKPEADAATKPDAPPQVKPEAGTPAKPESTPQVRPESDTPAKAESSPSASAPMLRELLSALEADLKSPDFQSSSAHLAEARIRTQSLKLTTDDDASAAPLWDLSSDDDDAKTLVHKAPARSQKDRLGFGEAHSALGGLSIEVSLEQAFPRSMRGVGVPDVAPAAPHAPPAPANAGPEVFDLSGAIYGEREHTEPDPVELQLEGPGDPSLPGPAAGVEHTAPEMPAVDLSFLEPLQYAPAALMAKGLERTAIQPPGFDPTASEPAIVDRTAIEPPGFDSTAFEPAVADRTAIEPPGALESQSAPRPSAHAGETLPESLWSIVEPPTAERAAIPPPEPRWDAVDPSAGGFASPGPLPHGYGVPAPPIHERTAAGPDLLELTAAGPDLLELTAAGPEPLEPTSFEPQLLELTAAEGLLQGQTTSAPLIFERTASGPVPFDGLTGVGELLEPSGIQRLPSTREPTRAEEETGIQNAGGRTEPTRTADHLPFFDEPMDDGLSAVRLRDFDLPLEQDSGFGPSGHEFSSLESAPVAEHLWGPPADPLEPASRFPAAASSPPVSPPLPTLELSRGQAVETRLLQVPVLEPAPVSPTSDTIIPGVAPAFSSPRPPAPPAPLERPHTPPAPLERPSAAATRAGPAAAAITAMDPARSRGLQSSPPGPSAPQPAGIPGTFRPPASGQSARLDLPPLPPRSAPPQTTLMEMPPEPVRPAPSSASLTELNQRFSTEDDIVDKQRRVLIGAAIAGAILLAVILFALSRG